MTAETKTEAKTTNVLETPVQGAHPLARTVGPLEFTAEQRKMIRDSLLNGASEAEAEMLMELARLRRLNPITKQVHFVKRWDGDKQAYVWAAQVGIDGFRAIAERTGKYAGQDEPEFEYDAHGKIVLCRVRVYRSDWVRPAVGVAHFSEYAQTKKDGNLTKMWAEKPHVMISKCAEAQAHRRAFSEDTSGLYIPEEMEKELNEAPTEGIIQPTSGTRVDSVAAKVAQKAAQTKAASAKASTATVQGTQSAAIKAAGGITSSEMNRVSPAPVKEPVAGFDGPDKVKGKKLSELTTEQLKTLKSTGEASILKEPDAKWAGGVRANLVEIDAEIAERGIAAEKAAKAQASAPVEAEPENDAKEPDPEEGGKKAPF
jgi:phage recombination protein Bet